MKLHQFKITCTRCGADVTFKKCRCDDKPKRKPFKGGTLLMTEEELEEFSKIIGKKVTLVEIVNDAIFISYFVESAGDYGGEEISSIKAILYLAERFNLTGKK